MVKDNYSDVFNGACYLSLLLYQFWKALSVDYLWQFDDQLRIFQR